MDVDHDRARTSRQFEVLVVCTANLCRSPMVEGLLRATLADNPAAWSIRSAGTHADDGRPVHPSTAQALFEYDATLPEGWRSRLLRPEDVERADLVLTATRAHRSEVVRTAPQASTRTFTLRQFLRLLRTPGVEAPPPHRHAHPGDDLVDTALAARGLGPPAPADADDVADPIGRPYPVFRALAGDLADELRVLNGPAASIRPVLTPFRPTVTSRAGSWWSRSS